MEKRTYQICERCVMDTTDFNISFDEKGFCNHCTAAIERMKSNLYTTESERLDALEKLVDIIKRNGNNSTYDCLIGLSGGVDSTAVAYEVVKLGLRPLAIHIDNSWNTEIANLNIKNTAQKLGLDLKVIKFDEKEFLGLQLAFLKSSLANCEAPTDHAITATLFKVAKENNIKFILSGSNLTSEAIMPVSWGHYNQDLKLLKAVHKKYGIAPINTIPTISIMQYFSYVFIDKIKQIPFLNYFDYDKESYKEIIIKELDWVSYGGKHHESIWTRFFQSYYLVEKFGFDKRRAHYSSLICSDQLTRVEAIELLKEDPIDKAVLEEDKDYIKSKFGISDEEFRKYMNAVPKEAKDYPNNKFIYENLRYFKNVFRKIATTAK